MAESGIAHRATPRRLSLRVLAGMSVHALGVNVVWVSYSSIILPVQVQAVVPPERIGIVLGTIAAVSVSAGLLANILAGIVSDRGRGRFGRRAPAMVAGAVLSVPAILLGALPLTVLLVLASYLGVQVFSNASAGAHQPLLADFVPEKQRGVAAGFTGLSTLIGAALGFGAVTALLGAGLHTGALLLVGLVFLSATIATVAVIRPYDHPRAGAGAMGLGEALVDIVRVRRGTGGFFWFVLGSLLSNVGISSFQYYGLYYLETVLRLADPLRGLQIAGLLNLVVSMGAAVVAGVLSDRFGRRRLLVGAALMGGVSCLSFPFLGSFAPFLALAALYAVSTGVFLSVSRAWAADLVPEDEAGKYMAYNNLASGLAHVIGAPLFGGLLNLWGAPTVGSFVLVFGVVAGFYGASALVLAWKAQGHKEGP